MQITGAWGRTAGVAAAVLVGCAGVAGCQLSKSISIATHNVSANRATVNQFTAGLKNGAPKAFEVTYAVTGNSPGTVVYAVQPPDDVAFRETPTGAGAGSGAFLVTNPAGAFSCTPGTATDTPAGPGWTCQKLGKLTAAARSTLLDVYTPAHWVAFLEGFSVAAGIAGDKVHTSSMTVNGFSMHCVDFVAPGVPGTSTICTTAQNLLGYVKVAGGSAASFAITAYSASPPASLFALPAGARVTAPASQAG
jgi:hypothetical protein